MFTISNSYTLIYQIDFAPEYQFSKCKKLINTHRGNIIKKTVNGGSIGFCIKGKFYSITYLRTHLVKIKNEKLPF